MIYDRIRNNNQLGKCVGFTAFKRYSVWIVQHGGGVKLWEDYFQTFPSD